MTIPSANVNPMSGPGDSRPVPDPTLLTTQQLLREMANLKEVIFTRLDGMDRAMIVFTEAITRVPTDVDKQVGHLKELHDEKFDGIQRQFHERDIRFTQADRDSKLAIDAAFQSSDRAITKSEIATNKQLDALDGKISDLKDRLLLIEGRGSGMQASWLIIVAVIGVLGTVGGLLLAVLR